MPGEPVPSLGWPGTKNAQGHPVRPELVGVIGEEHLRRLAQVLAASRRASNIFQERFPLHHDGPAQRQWRRIDGPGAG